MYTSSDRDLEDIDTTAPAIVPISSTMDAHTGPAKIENEAVTPSPASMLMRLPAEARLHVFKFIDPRYNPPSDYAGLLSTCRQLRTEFEHEVLKNVRRHYTKELPNLHGITIRPRRPLVMADVSTLDISIKLHSWYPGVYTHLTHPSCFSWPWIKTLIITLDLRALHDFFPHMAATILPHSQHLSVQTIMQKNSELTLRSEVDTVIFRFSKMLPNTLLVANEHHTFISTIKESYLQLTRGRGHEWRETLDFDDRGSITQSVYRRRSRGMKMVLRCLATVLTSLEVCLEKLKPAVPIFGAILVGALLPAFWTILIFWFCSFDVDPKMKTARM
jgi:hypothetical protein